jgi:hypothetical protein
VAKIPAEKLKRSREKKKIWPNFPKSGRKGAKLCIDVFVKLAELSQTGRTFLMYWPE